MPFTLAPSFPVPKAGGTIDPLSQYGSLLGLGIGALLPSLLGNRQQQPQMQNASAQSQAQQPGIAGLLAKLSNPSANVTPGDAAGLPTGTQQQTGAPQQGQLPAPAQPQGGGGPNAALIQAGLQRQINPFASATTPAMAPPVNLQQLIQQRLASLGGQNLYNMNPSSPGFGTGY